MLKTMTELLVKKRDSILGKPAYQIVKFLFYFIRDEAAGEPAPKLVTFLLSGGLARQCGVCPPKSH